MPDDWMLARVEALERQAQALLAQDLPPAVRHVLEEYQALLERASRVAGALHEENRSLRAIIAHQEGEAPWDESDWRW